MTRYYDDPPEGKMGFSRWKEHYKTENKYEYIELCGISEQYFYEDCEEYNDWLWDQYEEYLDTEEPEEHDRMAQEEDDEKRWGE